MGEGLTQRSRRAGGEAMGGAGMSGVALTPSVASRRVGFGGFTVSACLVSFNLLDCGGCVCTLIEPEVAIRRTVFARLRLCLDILKSRAGRMMANHEV